MSVSNAALSCLPYTVIRDDREKAGHGWEFRSSKYCQGTIRKRLKTADYTLVGFEKYIAIERKESVTEFVGSITNPNFREELNRMADIMRPIVMLEFGIGALLEWPSSSNLSAFHQARMPLTNPGAAISAFIELQCDYPYVNFMFVEKRGEEVARCIFKKVIERYAKFVQTRDDEASNSTRNDEIV